MKCYSEIPSFKHNHIKGRFNTKRILRPKWVKIVVLCFNPYYMYWFTCAHQYTFYLNILNKQLGRNHDNALICSHKQCYTILQIQNHSIYNSHISFVRLKVKWMENFNGTYKCRACLESATSLLVSSDETMCSSLFRH